MPERIDMSPLLVLMKEIIASATAQQFEVEQPEEKKGWDWLAHWSAVHNVMADVARDLLSGGERPFIDFGGNRNSLFEVIEYLLSHEDPTPKDEQLATAKITTSSGNTPKKVGTPLTLAINSVRGRSFQALVNFAYRDAQLMPKEQPVKILPDVKKLYENVLSRENTRAIMFMFGHYLSSIYFKDQEWARGLLPHIFPPAQDKKHLYLAAWEGYLANQLYEDMFFDSAIQELYERGIGLAEPKDPNRERVRIPIKVLPPTSAWRSCITRRSILNILCSRPSGRVTRNATGSSSVFWDGCSFRDKMPMRTNFWKANLARQSD